MHSACAGFRDRDRLREYAPGLPVVPFGIEKIDVESEHHTGTKLVAHYLDRSLIGAYRMMPIARILEGPESMSVNAGLAHAEAPPLDRCFDRFHGDGHLLAGSEQIEPDPICGDAPFVDFAILPVRFPETEGALHMGAVAAVFRVYFADDEVATLE